MIKFKVVLKEKPDEIFEKTTAIIRYLSEECVLLIGIDLRENSFPAQISQFVRHAVPFDLNSRNGLEKIILFQILMNP